MTVAATDEVVMCPHGDNACPCPDGDPCHYESYGDTPMTCPTTGRDCGHCHIEGCSWHACGSAVDGECGLMKLGFPPAMTTPDGEQFWSMSQAKPGLPGWACGWLRTPLNVGWKKSK